MDRYTNPETSKLLAEAGLGEPREFEKVRCGSPECAKSFGVGEVHECTEDWCVDPCIRALDLTDVLHELTRPRPEEKDARPLVGDGTSVNIDICPSLTKMNEFCEIRMRRDDAPSAPLRVRERNNSPVEAAALVLLALLRERKS